MGNTLLYYHNCTLQRCDFSVRLCLDMKSWMEPQSEESLFPSGFSLPGRRFQFFIFVAGLELRHPAITWHVVYRHSIHQFLYSFVGWMTYLVFPNIQSHKVEFSAGDLKIMCIRNTFVKCEDEWSLNICNFFYLPCHFISL
jgi:hypothetical protein